MVYWIEVLWPDTTLAAPNPPTPHNGTHYRRIASNLALQSQVLCIFWIWFKTLVGDILGFCLYQLPPRVVVVPQHHFPLWPPNRSRPVSWWLPPDCTLSTQTLWCHFRPFFLTVPTGQLHRVLCFFCFQITTPGTQRVPGVCKLKVCDFCFLLLGPTWVWTPYFYTPITMKKMKEKRSNFLPYFFKRNQTIIKDTNTSVCISACVCIHIFLKNICTHVYRKEREKTQHGVSDTWCWVGGLVFAYYNK